MCSSTHTSQRDLYLCVCYRTDALPRVCKSSAPDTRNKCKEPAVNEHIEHDVDTNSAEFKHGVEPGLKDKKNWKAGHELGLELKKEVEDDEPMSKSRLKQPPAPLFMSDSAEGNKGNPQDEKDETAE